VAVCLLVVSLLAADASRPPDRQLTARAALKAIRWYQVAISPRLGPLCRFTPTCSRYAAAVIERHGIVRGGWQAARRIVRCGPWTPAGTKDLPE
jgi:putative membrane protein insertion efficiency factor